MVPVWWLIFRQCFHCGIFHSKDFSSPAVASFFLPGQYYELKAGLLNESVRYCIVAFPLSPIRWWYLLSFASLSFFLLYIPLDLLSAWWPNRHGLFLFTLFYSLPHVYSYSQLHCRFKVQNANKISKKYNASAFFILALTTDKRFILTEVPSVVGLLSYTWDDVGNACNSWEVAPGRTAPFPPDVEPWWSRVRLRALVGVAGDWLWVFFVLDDETERRDVCWWSEERKIRSLECNEWEDLHESVSFLHFFLFVGERKEKGGEENERRRNTAWCSEIDPLTSLDVPELHASSDVREPILLHQAVQWNAWAAVEPGQSVGLSYSTDLPSHPSNARTYHTQKEKGQ